MTDRPDGDDDTGPYWECEDCTTRHRSSRARAECCFWD